MNIHHATIWQNPNMIHLTIECQGHEIRSHRTPMLAMCRYLRDRGATEDDVLAVTWRDGRPSLRIRIGWGASMTIGERDRDGLVREPFRKHPRASRGRARDGHV